MKALLANLSPQKALGVYVGEHDITLSRVASTPFGPVEVECHQECFDNEQLTTVLDRMLAARLGSRRRTRLPVALGLAPSRVFFSTRPIRAVNVDAAPEVLLHEILQSPNVTVDDMAVDVLKTQPGKRPVAKVASCRKKYLAGLIAVLEGRGLRLVCAEPGPCALLRAATNRYRTPFRLKTVARIFLGATQGLAVAVTAGLPVVWRPFTLDAGGETAGLCSIVRLLEAVLGYCGIDGAMEAVLVHGRPELRTQRNLEQLQHAIGSRVAWHDGPGLDDRAVAFGLALGCFGGTTGFDLARAMKAPPTLRDIFPRGEVAVQVALLVCMGLFLNFTAQRREQAYQTIEAQYRQHPWLADRSRAALLKEQQDLDQRLQAVQRFVDSRVLWTRYAQELAAGLPAAATLDSFQGVAELGNTGGTRSKQAARPKRRLLVTASAPLAADGSVPPEIESFASVVRGHDPRKSDFPILSLPDIQLRPATNGQPARASVTVLCLPAARPDARHGRAK